MKRSVLALIAMLCVAFAGLARTVTVRAVDQPAAGVFRSIMEQTGKNFVYSSELLSGLKVTVNVRNAPLKTVLETIFRDTDITYRIKGNNVVLKRKKNLRKKKSDLPTAAMLSVTAMPTADTTLLEEIVVVSRLEAPAMETSEMGASKITAGMVRTTPVLFGESDVIKTLQSLPGVTEGTEGMAGMHVHGGNADENLYMLDNVPLYQVNHFAGLFSAFNPDIIRYMDFFKTSIPAKYDGRLSSFMDVRLLNGNTDGHHGSARLGLTSGAFNISGPIGHKTTYLAGLRRSWFDVLTTPLVALVNAASDDEKTRFHYNFMDFNAKLSHRFSSRLNGFISAYYGNDLLKTGYEDLNEATTGWYDKGRLDFNWGNLVVQAGLNCKIRTGFSAEITAAYTRFLSTMKNNELYRESGGQDSIETSSRMRTDNNINDWILRGDFDWQAAPHSRVRFGAGYVRHTFLPVRFRSEFSVNGTQTALRDSSCTYGANEFNAYIEDDWKITGRLRANIGVHASLFNIDGRTHGGISPRLSAAYRIGGNYSVKAAYSRTVQYVHQLAQSQLSLPTDQWVPVTGQFKPQTADKIAAGAYWQSDDGNYAMSVEGYYKTMRNLIEYADEFWLQSMPELWNANLTTGRGRAKGIDFKIEKTFGKLTGHIGYSLAWSDRKFEDKNGGRWYPARFDNRHTINIAMNWNINDRVALNALWTGHSGNRFTLLPAMFESPGFGSVYEDESDGVPVKGPINNYRLPFYHRLDLSCTVRNSRGFWTFGLWNAYCHMNTVAIHRGHREVTERTPDGMVKTSKPVFQKVKLLPLIPSISYTWQF